MLHDLMIGATDYLRSGGGVILPIILISLWMWALIITKITEFYSWRRLEKPVVECARQHNEPDFMAAPWQMDIIKTFFQYRDVNMTPDKREIARIQRAHEVKVNRYVNTILVLAAVAPLLGLLGTVIGMIKTFDVISLFGTGNAKAMASGISEALITTQTGLVVAVPGLILGNFINRRAQGVKTRINRFCLGLLREF